MILRHQRRRIELRVRTEIALPTVLAIVAQNQSLIAAGWKAPPITIERVAKQLASGHPHWGAAEARLIARRCLARLDVPAWPHPSA